MTTIITEPKIKKLTKTQLKRIEEQEMQYEFAKMWLRNDYNCITTVSVLKKVLNKFGDEFAMDTETSGLDIRPGKTELFGISLSNNEAEAYWIPNPTDKMKQMLQAKMKTSRIILAKADYDIPILENNGIEVVDFVDIFIPVHLLYPNERLGGLKGTADKLLTGIGETLLLNKLLGKSKTEIEYGDFNKLEDWVQLAYAAQDADITWRLWELDKIKEIETKYPVIWKLEHDLVRPLIHMKLSGIKIDIDLIKEQDIVLEQARTKIVEKVNKIASKKSGEKIELNLNSSQQKADFLFGSFIKPKEKGAKGRHRKSDALIGLDGKPLVPLERTESGRGSTMKKFMNSIKSKHPAVELILQASSLASLRSNFTNKIPNIMDDDGKLRTSFWALGAATGRFTSSGPNLQNAPKSQADYIPVNIRNCFIADKDYVLLDIDYSQIELRLAASFSGEPVWIKAFESGESPHVATAIEMFGKKYTEDEYKKSKNMNFGILYGQTAYAFALIYAILESVAQKFVDKWFGALPVLVKWIDKEKSKARKLGIAYTYFGRSRPLRTSDFGDTINSDVRHIVEHWERIAVNFIIQGTAADIMKMAIVSCYKTIIKHKLKAQILLTVHDELLFQVHKSHLKKASKLLKEAMTIEIPGFVPLNVDMKIGSSWGTCSVE